MDEGSADAGAVASGRLTLPRRAAGSRDATRGLAWAAAIAAGVFAVAWVRHANYYSGAFDLGVFDQGVWRLAQGETRVSLIERSIFADHFSAVLVLFAPLYALAATPAWLIGAQALALGLTVLPMRALARDVGASQGVASVMVAGSAPLLAAGLFDFHPSTIAVPFIAATVLHARRGEPRRSLLFALCVLVCRADLAWVLVGVAVIAARRVRWWVLALGLAGSAAGVLVPAVLGNESAWDPYYGHLGTGALDVAVHPWRLASALVDPEAVKVLTTWLLPVGLLTVFRPRWLVAVVVGALPILVSGWYGTKLPWFHYGAPYAPLAVGGALECLAQPPPVLRGLRPLAVRAAPVVGVIAALATVSPLSPRAPRNLNLWEVLRKDPASAPEEVVRLIGDDDAVSGPEEILAHVMHRDEAHLFPWPFEPAPGVYPEGLDPPADRARASRIDVVVLRAGQEGAALIASDFHVVAEPEGYQVFARG